MRDTRPDAEARGVGLVAATFTALHDDGTLNLGMIERQADRLARQGVRGAFVCGTSGEFASLTGPERMAVAERWREVAPAGLEVIVHVGHTGVAGARELAAHAERIGAAGIAAVPPYYFRPGTVGELVDVSARIAAAAPRTPFYYYHIPSLTGVALPMSAFLPAAVAAIPTLAGIKFTDGDLVAYARCVEIAAGRQELFLGKDELLLAAMALGARSAVGTTYNVAAPVYHAMADAFGRGDLAAARQAQGLTNRMIETAVAYGGLPAFKAMMAWFGVDCGPCRPPLPTVDGERAEAMRAELEGIGFFSAVGEPVAAPVAP